jgi:hypothetical protein
MASLRAPDAGVSIELDGDASSRSPQKLVTRMKAFSLPKDDVDALVAYLSSLKKK